ncbi:hypothetical protein Tco_0200549 [Tanacetum coccineum]
MADNQAIEYAPQCGELIVESLCTAIAYDLNPPANDSEVRPLKEYKIKFTVMNGKKPLTFNFKTFVESTSLDYNEGTYVSHPSPEAVKDPSKVTLIELTASIIAVNNHETLVSTLLFSIKRKKKKFQTVTQTLPKSQGPEASGAHSKKRTKSKYKKTTLRPKQHHPGSHSPPDEGTRKSQLFLKGKTTDPKDSGGNDQPANKGLPSTVSNEGTDVELDFEPLKLTSMADFQALLGDDDLKEDSDDDDVFEAGEEMDEDIQEPKIEET